MKARLVTTNRKTRKSVWRVFSVVNGEPRGGGGVSVFPGGDPREGRDSQPYHVGYPLPPFAGVGRSVIAPGGSPSRWPKPARRGATPQPRDRCREQRR